MDKRLKKVLCLGLSALMLASAGVAESANYGVHAARHAKVTKMAYRHGQRNKYSGRSRRNVKRRTLKRYQRKVHRMNDERTKKRRTRKPKHRVYKSRFQRSNRRRLLKRSGYFSTNLDGFRVIFNKYAPNDKRAVVPKWVKATYWYRGKFGQSNPTPYYYVSVVHGWLKLK